MKSLGVAKTGNTYFTSDMHFGHVNIIHHAKRPFADVEEMNEALVENYNSVVKPADTVYILGDHALGTVKESLEYTRRLNGNKILIAGNHDKCWKGHKKYEKFIPDYEDVGLTVLQGPLPFNLFGKSVQVCHFPQQVDWRHVDKDAKDLAYKPDRFADYRPARSPVIHGHVHQMWKARGTDLNVGVDVWDFKPVPAETVKDYLDMMTTR
jgi:calcineurin-like phosphoesterase family protein